MQAEITKEEGEKMCTKKIRRKVVQIYAQPLTLATFKDEVAYC